MDAETLRRRLRGEALVFTSAVALGVLHALDDAFLGRNAGVGAGHHALAALLAVAIGVAAVVAFPSARTGLRAALALLLGVPALVNGGLHVMHVADEGMSVGDLSGLLAAGAGLTLVALAAILPWRHRGAHPLTPGRRWARRTAVVAGGVVAGVLVMLPVGMALTDAHKFRDVVGAPPNAAYEDVSFTASDGVRLAGWYRPSRNGAAVLLVHGGGGHRGGAVAHARMLERHGFGVLLYDARGRGESEGSSNGYGWGWPKDAAAALDFLADRNDVEQGRIGALGLSSGADTLIEVAARRDDLNAVVADGAALRSYEDYRREFDADPMTPSMWMTFAAVRVLSGSDPAPPALADEVARIDSPLLLISAGPHAERSFNRSYAAAAPDAEHWNMPRAGHTNGLQDEPDEYERRVARFFAAELGPVSAAAR